MVPIQSLLPLYFSFYITFVTISHPLLHGLHLVKVAVFLLLKITSLHCRHKDHNTVIIVIQTCFSVFELPQKELLDVSQVFSAVSQIFMRFVNWFQTSFAFQQWKKRWLPFPSRNHHTSHNEPHNSSPFCIKSHELALYHLVTVVLFVS